MQWLFAGWIPACAGMTRGWISACAGDDTRLDSRLGNYSMHRLKRLRLVPSALASCFALPRPWPRPASRSVPDLTSSMDSYLLHGPGQPLDPGHACGLCP